MSEKMTRRDVLSTGVIAGATIVGAGVTGVALNGSAEAKKMAYPWPYVKLNSKKVAERAYKDYFSGGCMYACFEAIMGELADKLGGAYKDFPFAYATYGGGGVASWGTICGCLNGAAAALALIYPSSNPLRNQMINEVMAWYERTALPVFVPKNPVKVDKSFKQPTSKAASPLCHASIANWSAKTGVLPSSPLKSERCGRLCADVAKYVVDMLNKAAKGQFVAGPQISDNANECVSCHGMGKQVGNIQGKMDCESCHPDAHK